jgi:transcription initiation factor TFIIIB Brf1 subunit/transcription initiation factor TFIIB
VTVNPIIKRIAKRNPYKMLYPFYRDFTKEVIWRAYEIIRRVWEKDKFKLIGRHPIAIFGGAVYIAQIQLISEDSLEYRCYGTQSELVKALGITLTALRKRYQVIDEELDLGIEDSAIRYKLAKRLPRHRITM